MEHLNVLILGAAALAILLVLRAVRRRQGTAESLADDDEMHRSDRPVGYGLERDAAPARAETEQAPTPPGGSGAVAAAAGGALILGVGVERARHGGDGEGSSGDADAGAAGSDGAGDGDTGGDSSGGDSSGGDGGSD